MTERQPQNIFHEAVDEPCKGFLRLVERLSVQPGEPDEFHEEDDTHVLSGNYEVADDTPFLPIKGIGASFRLREGQQWYHRLILTIGLGDEESTEVRLIHAQWLQPREWFVGEQLTEELADVADTDYFSDESFFAQTVGRVEELEAAGKLELLT
jgi:hypothetical protein